MPNKNIRFVLGAAALGCRRRRRPRAGAEVQPVRLCRRPEGGYFNPDNRFGTQATGSDAGLKFGKAINQWFDVRVGGSYARARRRRTCVTSRRSAASTACSS